MRFVLSLIAVAAITLFLATADAKAQCCTASGCPAVAAFAPATCHAAEPILAGRPILKAAAAPLRGGGWLVRHRPGILFRRR